MLCAASMMRSVTTSACDTATAWDASLAFRAADDFANRATLRPCRASRGQVAIDPDGTVHAIDYAGAPLGNLLDAPLLALWNSAPMLALREHALARRPRCLSPMV